MKTINISDELHDSLKNISSEKNLKLATMIQHVLEKFSNEPNNFISGKPEITFETVKKCKSLKAIKSGELHENKIEKDSIATIQSIRENYVLLLLPNSDEIIVRFSIINEWFELEIEEFEKMDEPLEKLIAIICNDLNEKREILIHRVLFEYASKYFNRQK